MRVILKPLDVSKAKPDKTRVRVYCMHGYWDGTYVSSQRTHTSNQPDKLVTMVNIRPDAHTSFGPILRAQHPRQCREIVREYNPNEIWVPCRKLTGEPDDSNGVISTYPTRGEAERSLEHGGYFNSRDFEVSKFIKVVQGRDGRQT